MVVQRVVVIGGGIIGAAVARALSVGPRDRQVTLVEKEATLGRHQTGHNSGVVHAGIYYPPGSVKAELSRIGMRRLHDYCLAHGLEYQEVGKLVVATDEVQERRLRDIESRARANQVPVRWIDGGDLDTIEPHVRGRSGLHSPTTAIVDFARVAQSYAADAVANGATVRTGFAVTAITAGRTTRVTAANGETLEADRVIVAAGLQTDRVAHLAGDSLQPRIVPFRGEFHELAPEARHLVTGLIYPVPDPRYPFLGIHLTRRIDGRVLVGPNAVLALNREGYSRTDVSLDQVRELIGSKGFRSFARANAVTGAREMVGSLSQRAFLAAARAYVPALRPGDLRRAPAGVRAQAMDPDGSLVDDFRFSRVGPVLAVRNAPSPAATAALPIADQIVDQMDGQLGTD